MNNADINSKFSRIIRMIEEIRKFALDGSFDEDIDEGNIHRNETLHSAIDMLGDDIHDCDLNAFEDGNNPHSMREAEFDLFLALISEMTPKGK